MPFAALAAWITTAGGGLYLLTIWLIEYDREFQSAAATRLPVPVIGLHVLLAIIGMGVWIYFLITGRSGLTWIAALILVAVVALGLTMAVRWVGVYQEHSAPRSNRARRAAMAMAAGGSPAGHRAGSQMAVPPERHFPVPVVIAHGIFAMATLILVVVTALTAGGS
jgi:hypothetical protein